MKGNEDVLDSGPECMRFHLNLICLAVVGLMVQELGLKTFTARRQPIYGSIGPGIDCWLATTKTCNPNNQRLKQSSSVLTIFQ